jgi:hypothetical protein
VKESMGCDGERGADASHGTKGICSWPKMANCSQEFQAMVRSSERGNGGSGEPLPVTLLLQRIGLGGTVSDDEQTLGLQFNRLLPSR